MGNYGATLCQLFIFTAKTEGGIRGDDTADDETFLETENRRLVESNYLHKTAIAQLEKENDLIKEVAQLETRLLQASLLQAETNGKLLAAAKFSLKQSARVSLLSALGAISLPLDGIVAGLKRVFAGERATGSLAEGSLAEGSLAEGPLTPLTEGSLTPLTEGSLTEGFLAKGSLTEGSSLMGELRNIATSAFHQRVLIKSAFDLDTLITGNKAMGRQTFSPAKLCRDAVALQSLTAKRGVAVVLTSTLSEGTFEGTPSQLNLVLMNLLSGAMESTWAGKVELTADVVKNAGKYQELRFAVTGGGRAPPEEVRAKFFGTRGQLGNESEQIEEFGFAAYAAYEFVKRMRGVLELRPATNGGEGGGEGGGSELSFKIRVDKIRRASLGGTSSIATYSPETIIATGKREQEQERKAKLRLELQREEWEVEEEQEQEQGREELENGNTIGRLQRLFEKEEDNEAVMREEEEREEEEREDEVESYAGSDSEGSREDPEEDTARKGRHKRMPGRRQVRVEPEIQTDSLTFSPVRSEESK